MTSTAASTIPPELFQLILKALRPPDSLFRTKYNETDISRRELARCGLVCKFWARQCQQRLFYSVRLRCQKDVAQLRELLDTPGSKIGKYIRTFRIEFCEATNASFLSEPWMHLVPALYKSYRLRYCKNVTLSLRGPLPARCRTLRSIHAVPPRTVPSFSTDACVAPG